MKLFMFKMVILWPKTIHANPYKTDRFCNHYKCTRKTQPDVIFGPSLRKHHRGSWPSWCGIDGITSPLSLVWRFLHFIRSLILCFDLSCSISFTCGCYGRGEGLWGSSCDLQGTPVEEPGDDEQEDDALYHHEEQMALYHLEQSEK